MNICVIGTGYVGLVTGVVFADLGNDVVCVDKDEAKVNRLRAGDMPIYEPGLEELVLRNVEEGRLVFTTDIDTAVRRSDVVYICVGTPPKDDGSTARLSASRMMYVRFRKATNVVLRFATTTTSLKETSSSSSKCVKSNASSNQAPTQAYHMHTNRKHPGQPDRGVFCILCPCNRAASRTSFSSSQMTLATQTWAALDRRRIQHQILTASPLAATGSQVFTQHRLCAVQAVRGCSRVATQTVSASMALSDQTPKTVFPPMNRPLVKCSKPVATQRPSSVSGILGIRKCFIQTTTGLISR